MMDNQHTKQDVYEAYVDASVALLMQRYCDILDENIAGTDGSSAEGESAAFPKALDDRCRSLIKRTMKRRKFRQAMRYAGKTAFSLCCAVIVSLALLSVLFVTVEAVRLPLINLWITHSPNNYLEINGTHTGEEVFIEEAFDPADPLRYMLPPEYQLTMQNGATLTDFTALYADPNENTIYIHSCSIQAVSGIDMEGVDSIQEFHIFNCDAILVTEGETTRMMITDEENGAIYTLIVNGNPDLDAVDLANEFLLSISHTPQ